MAWNESWQPEGYSQDVKSIKSEPTSIPMLILMQAMELFRSIPKTVASGKLDIYGLLTVKFQLRFLHAHTRVRSNVDYNREYKLLQTKLKKIERDSKLWEEGDRDKFLEYFDLLMDWYDLEATLYERFNLLPAEDIELVWPDVPYKELGIDIGDG